MPDLAATGSTARASGDLRARGTHDYQIGVRHGEARVGLLRCVTGARVDVAHLEQMTEPPQCSDADVGSAQRFTRATDARRWGILGKRRLAPSNTCREFCSVDPATRGLDEHFGKCGLLVSDQRWSSVTQEQRIATDNDDAACAKRSWLSK